MSGTVLTEEDMRKIAKKCQRKIIKIVEKYCHENKGNTPSLTASDFFLVMTNLQSYTLMNIAQDNFKARPEIVLSSQFNSVCALYFEYFKGICNRIYHNILKAEGNSSEITEATEEKNE